jgi:hypothetical protein
MPDAQRAHGALARHQQPSSAWTVGQRALRHILGFAPPRGLELTAVESSWGLLPQLSLAAGATLAFIAFATGFTWLGQAGRQSLFWAGVWLLVLPITLRLTWPFVSRWERLSLLILGAVALYTLKILGEPVGFSGFDEFLHWRTAQDIIATGHLFTPNALLPISPAYPGLEVVTTALANVTGSSIFATAVVLLGLLRVLFICALFLLFEQIIHSTRLSALACIIYMSNWDFVDFDASFAYETLGIVLLILILLAEARGRTRRKHVWVYRLGIGVPLIVALAPTHHVTAFFAIVLLAGLLALSAFNRESAVQRMGLAALLLVGVVAPWAWSTLMNIPLGYYLGPEVSSGFSDLYEALTTLSLARKPFATADETRVPLWLMMSAFSALVIVCIGLTTGFFRTLALAGVRLSRRHHLPFLSWTNSRLVLLTILTLGYPLSIALRLTEGGWELGNRMAPFVYLGVGPVLAVAIASYWQKPATSRYKAAAIGTGLSIVLLGGVFVGSQVKDVPPRYRVAADASSIEPMGIDASQWTRRWLGEDHNFAADRINQILLATYGRQQVITPVDVANVLFSQSLGPEELNAIKVGALEYLLIDLRITQAPPAFGVYFSKGEAEEIHEAPPDPQALLKFDRVGRVGRPFDNGFIVIYDVADYMKALRDAHE